MVPSTSLSLHFLTCQSGGDYTFMPHRFWPHIRAPTPLLDQPGLVRSLSSGDEARCVLSD